MVRPAQFGFNPQTAASNLFQKAPEEREDPGAIHKKALREFNALADTLTRLGIDVLIFNDSAAHPTPDSIFPNNWFSTHPGGIVFRYPMMAENRRRERSGTVMTGLGKRFKINRTTDLTMFEREGKFLEGTGSLVLDHKNRTVYACLSPRTNEELVKLWAAKMGFETVSFSAFDAGGEAVYHTNVLMCVGDGFAVVCLKSVKDPGERKSLRDSLAKNGHEIVEISLEQMQKFAGNMLLLRNKKSESFLVISRQALDSLAAAQVETLSGYAVLVPVELSTIETYGGGSARCMIAENFLTARS